MPDNTERAVTLHAIARDAGVSRATVSYALRNHPKISAETRAAVLAAAAKLGYRPNPRVASLMTHIRRAQAGVARDRLAFVWVQASRRESADNPFLQIVLSGARRRAEQLGFALDEFWAQDRGMTPRRLQQVLHARGIAGVVLSPVTTAVESIQWDWDWERFAVAVIGNVTWNPELHHAGHHHFLGMRLALREIAKLGCRCPAALIEPTSNQRAKRAWEAAFLTHHPAARPTASRLLRVAGAEEHRATIEWLETIRADALLVSELALAAPAALRAVCRRRQLRLFTLYRDGATPAEIGGIDQC